jgi:hypothetical protein
MKRSINLILCCAVLLMVPCGCGHKDSAEEAGGHGQSQVKLCGFKENHGVFVNDEVRRALGLATLEVTPKALPQTIRGTARVFAAGKASMLVDTNTARAIKVGQRVLLDKKHDATVVAVENESGPLTGNVEVIIGFAGDTLGIGAHVAASLQIQRREALPAVPESSLLGTATGDYLFVANGQHFLRTPVKVAGKSEGWLAIADGLVEGDVVVTNGVEGLWCIELQATKGGYACCAVAKKE